MDNQRIHKKIILNKEIGKEISLFLRVKLGTLSIISYIGHVIKVMNKKVNLKELKQKLKILVERNENAWSIYGNDLYAGDKQEQRKALDMLRLERELKIQISELE